MHGLWFLSGRIGGTRPQSWGVCVSGDEGISCDGTEVLIMSSGSPTDLARKEANLIAVVEKILPDFARTCRAPDTPIVIMHQDAFAADYQEEEYRLIGMAIKFAGICGKEVRFHGKRNSVAREYNRVCWEYIGVKMEIDFLTMLLF
jgi:hypothetical protein